jgi:putative phosphoesterase
MKIGLLSDTHGWLDPMIENYIKPCDEIWHAGDVGNMNVLTTLEAYKPVRVVYGNIDGPDIRRHYSLHQRFNCEGLDIWITHIGGRPPTYTSAVVEILKEKPPHIFICGHSHILKVLRDQHYKGMLYLNPGAAGREGFHTTRTMLRFDITAGQIGSMEAIVLGPRSGTALINEEIKAM